MSKKSLRRQTLIWLDRLHTATSWLLRFRSPKLVTMHPLALMIFHLRLWIRITITALLLTVYMNEWTVKLKVRLWFRFVIFISPHGGRPHAQVKIVLMSVHVIQNITYRSGACGPKSVALCEGQRLWDLLSLSWHWHFRKSWTRKVLVPLHGVWRSLEDMPLGRAILVITSGTQQVSCPVSRIARDRRAGCLMS